MKAGRLDALAGLAAFALLGGLSGGRLMALAGPILVLIGLLPPLGMAALANGAVRRTIGLGGLIAIMIGGLAIAVPFAVLALVSRFALEWQAGSAFAGVAITAGMSAGGLGLVKAGCGRISGLLVPGLWSAALAFGWLATAAVLAGGPA